MRLGFAHLYRKSTTKYLLIGTRCQVGIQSVRLQSQLACHYEVQHHRGAEHVRMTVISLSGQRWTGARVMTLSRETRLLHDVPIRPRCCGTMQ